MEALFLKLLNMSITASWLVLAVILLRFLLKKAPRALTVALWAMVAIRLMFPFTIESIFSLIPSAETIPQNIVYSSEPTINTGIDIFNSTVNPIISESLAPNPGDSVNPLQVITAVAAVVWLIGIGVMLMYSLISYLYLRKKTRISMIFKDNIYLCDNIDTPFILGIFRPRIYLPSGMEADNMDYVIRHEEAHLKRKDHFWKPLGFALLSVYWFNPVLWIAYILLCRDIELACDEKVIKEFDGFDKKGYSEALVSCSVHRRTVMACPLAFGEVGVKSRIKSVLNYKKPAFWIIAIALLACIALAVCFLTDPYRNNGIDKITHEKGYTIIEQSEYELTLTIPKSVISDKAYTEEGLHFEKDQVIAYQTDTTKIYLESIYPVYGSTDTVWLNFDMSYDNLDKSDKVLTADKIGFKSLSFSNSVYLSDNILRDEVTEYEKAVRKGSSGPSNRFGLYATTEIVKNAVGSININVVCNQIVYEKNSLFLKNDKISESLSEFLDVAIYNHFANDKTVDNYPVMDYEIIGTKKDGNVTTVYMWVLYEEYSYDNELVLETGAHILTAITVKKVNDYYELVEYWEPRDGSYYDDDIKAKIPLHLQFKASDSQRYVKKQEEICKQKALDYFSTNIEEQNKLSETYLREKYPDYFDITDIKGIEMYVWVTDDGTLGYGILPGTNRNKTFDEIKSMKPANSEEIKAIISAYGISIEEFTAVAITITDTDYKFGFANKFDYLREYVPEYFGLSTDKGLEVYVWQLEENSYLCGLLPGQNLHYSDNRLWNLKPTTIEEMKYILGTYDINPNLISILPISVPHSSYHYEINAEYCKKIEEMFFDEWCLYMGVNFKNDNEFEIEFKHTATHKSTEGILATGPDYDIRAIYNGETISFGDYMRKVLNKEYEDKTLSWDAVLYTIPTNGTLSVDGNLGTFCTDFPKGEYVLCKPVYLEHENGDRVMKMYTCRFTVS